jgi:hypothetical protein
MYDLGGRRKSVEPNKGSDALLGKEDGARTLGREMAVPSEHLLEDCKVRRWTRGELPGSE